MALITRHDRILGFGEHVAPVAEKDVLQAKKVRSFIGSALTASLCSTFGLGTITSSAAGLAAEYKVKRLENACYGVMNEVAKRVADLATPLGETSECSSFPCADGMESFQWKKKLIESAQCSIVLSGNHCHGKAFGEILKLLRLQLKQKPQLQALFLVTDKDLTPANRHDLQKLESSFPEQFKVMCTDVTFRLNPSLKLVSNHCKFLVIDYGRYMILGGTGIDEKFGAVSGLGDQPARIPRAFRDMDFVFYSEGNDGVGRRVHLEATKLFLRWEGLLAREEKPKDSFAHGLLFKEPEVVDTYIDAFHKDLRTADQCDVKVLCMGPEHTENPLKKELLTQFKQAKTDIVIDHMFFHPDKDVEQALIDAANRGVKIKIITNQYDAESPRRHFLFAPRNQYNCASLISAVKPAFRSNIEIFNFIVPFTTLHKKVIVIDTSLVIAGSSNFGYKSLGPMCDHEINMIAKCHKLAVETLKILQIDSSAAYARRVIKPLEVPAKMKLYALIDRILAPIIG